MLICFSEPLCAPNVSLADINVPPKMPEKMGRKQRRRHRGRKRRRHASMRKPQTHAHLAQESSHHFIRDIDKLSEMYKSHDVKARDRTSSIAMKYDWKQKKYVLATLKSVIACRIFRAIFRRIVLLLRPPRIDLTTTAKLPYTSDKVRMALHLCCCNGMHCRFR